VVNSLKQKEDINFATCLFENYSSVTTTFALKHKLQETTARGPRDHQLCTV